MKINPSPSIKPFVKWAGGKKQLLPFLNIIMNIEYETYFEPFLGGGRVFLNLLPQKAMISDINAELITAWKTLKDQSVQVIKLLKKYVKALKTEKKAFYYHLRQQDINLCDDINKTARFIFLNKTCFNGLYRVNAKNQFNTPFNGQDQITLGNIINGPHLQALITFLKNNDIEILKQDYQTIISQTQKNDLLFCDPPYDSDTKTFNSYTAEGFNKSQQAELAKSLQTAHLKGVKWVLTNHDTQLIKQLYQAFYLVKIPVNRMINSQSDQRKNKTAELIITNYELSHNQKKQIDHLLFLKKIKIERLKPILN
ncbi:DNA adenine methylase [Candidatus Phytoplasma prunorum]|uniref:DNA adenine methylase n=1 Tax=Candidatus Phytoplasma prunorum TaxID=47565 RepID=UPI002FF26BE2